MTFSALTGRQAANDFSMSAHLEDLGQDGIIGDADSARGAPLQDTAEAAAMECWWSYVSLLLLTSSRFPRVVLSPA